MPRTYQPKKLPSGESNPLFVSRRIPVEQQQKRGRKRDESKTKERPIVAWDTEGVTLDNGTHICVYIACSTGQSLSDINGISSNKLLAFIIRAASENPKNALNVWYGGGYDVNMILKDMPQSLFTELWNGETVYYGRYGIAYRPRRTFDVRYYNNGLKQSVRIWDAIGFSQAPFLDAIEQWLGKDYEDLSLIKKGKESRHEFNSYLLDTLIPSYTSAELRALVHIEQRMFSALRECGIDLSRHDGAGSIAAELLKRYGIKTHFGNIPDDVERASQYAYFGGRIECLQFGVTGTTHHYDVCSAYPSAMLNMPSLSQGIWKRFGRQEILELGKLSEFGVYRIKWCALKELPFYPFPFRTTNGNVRFPPEGEGYVWTPELKAALELFSDSMDIQIMSGYEFHSTSDVKPFSFIQELYDKRKEYKKAGNHAQLVLKLGINSLYGKLAQRIGFNSDNPKKPPYHCMAYAGYITSHTRSQLLRAAMQHPESIIFFATDGIFSQEPLSLDIGSQLGQWEYDLHDELVSVQSGIYFYRNGDKWQNHYRGLGKDGLSPHVVIENWKQGQEYHPVQLNRFVGMGKALIGDNWNTHAHWIDEIKMVRLHPGGENSKRELLFNYSKKKHNPANGLQRTRARPVIELMSSPSRVPWEIGGERAEKELDA